MAQTFPAAVLQQAKKHFVKVERVCPFHEMYDCVEDRMNIPKSPPCVSAIQQITHFLKRVQDKYPMACNDTQIRKQQKEKLRNLCKFNHCYVSNEI